MSDSTMPDVEAPQRQRDQDFYMALVTIQAEGSLFKVPRGILESQSRTFQAMLSLSGEAVGTTDDAPICLPDVKADDFRLLLRVLLVDILGPKINPPSTSDEWITVVQLADKWGFDRVRSKAVQMIPYPSVPKSPAEKVALAFKLDINEWLMPGLLEMAKRPEPIGMDDVSVLGWDVALKIAAVRESLALSTQNLDSGPPSPPSRYGGGGIPTRPPQIRGETTCLISGIRDAEKVDFTHTIRKIFQLSPPIPPLPPKFMDM